MTIPISTGTATKGTAAGRTNSQQGSADSATPTSMNNGRYFQQRDRLAQLNTLPTKFRAINNPLTHPHHTPAPPKFVCVVEEAVQHEKGVIGRRVHTFRKRPRRDLAYERLKHSRRLRGGLRVATVAIAVMVVVAICSVPPITNHACLLYTSPSPRDRG